MIVSSPFPVIRTTIPIIRRHGGGGSGRGRGGGTTIVWIGLIPTITLRVVSFEMTATLADCCRMHHEGGKIGE